MNAGREIRDEIMAGAEQLDSMDGAARARWVRQAMTKLEQLVPDKNTRKRVLALSACRFPKEYLAKLRAEYLRLNDLDVFLEYVYRNPFYVKPERRDNTIYITKAPARPEEHALAQTPKDRRRHYCHCPYVREATEEIPRIYCHCGAGWCQHIWEAILDRPLRVEVIKSVLQGDDVCQFAVHL
jgi:hypothetical protein